MIADWYSLSHIVHGILFYAALWLVARRWPVEWRLLTALLIEASWEVIENTPMVIDRYRTGTAALGYSGDSVLNSVSDILMMVAGFLVARKLPWWGVGPARLGAGGDPAAGHSRQPHAQRVDASGSGPEDRGLAGWRMMGTKCTRKH
jgi:hypothetical protein